MAISIFYVLPVLCGIGQATARALNRAQQPGLSDIASLTLGKRQKDGSVTSMSTVWRTGNSRMVRSAEPGWDIWIDLEQSLWGFCDRTFVGTTQCGLAGRCTNSFSCSTGCGQTRFFAEASLMSSGSTPYCSFNYLTLSENGGPFTYVAYNSNADVKTYWAWTTSETPPSSSSEPSTSEGPSSETTARQAVQPTTCSPRNTASGADPTSDPNTESTASSTNNSGSKNDLNIGAILGGIIVCVALICTCVLFIYWTRQRSRTSAAFSAGDASQVGGASTGLPDTGLRPNYKSMAGVGNQPAHVPAELSETMTPIELPDQQYHGPGYRWN
ncbi:hypothetical protein C7999DRAFT_17995 [Corynascus novoguineensis]|uniref:Mid2 domain-containing protein n=1 Tax=Corynascus novoguineensis TaxID=1126955 RepID=A0AAN7CMC7_9PEZI|nr:hypothetical protein C7999DRAFT_17995 [Corynascus novoguineensis]